MTDGIMDPNFELEGAKLIEASAGTGKTYCIQTLFLRLVIEYGFQVQEILVVTFTDAATKELRDRLSADLRKCQLYVTDPQSLPDEDVKKRIEKIFRMGLKNSSALWSDADERAFRVRRALLDFDEAAISTIHGFCSRVLSRYAFECGSHFGSELIGGSTDIIDELCEDWWRQKMYGLAPETDIYSASEEFTLEQFKELARRRIQAPDASFRPAPIPSDEIRREILEIAQRQGPMIQRLLGAPYWDQGQYTPTKMARKLHTHLKELSEACSTERLAAIVSSCAEVLKTLSSGESLTWTANETWKLPPAAAAFVGACDCFRSHMPARTTSLQWRDGCPQTKEPKPELKKAFDGVVRAWPNAKADFEAILKNPEDYPWRDNKESRAISQHLEQMGVLLQPRKEGSAKELGGALKALAEFEENAPGKVKTDAQRLLDRSLADIKKLAGTALVAQSQAVDDIRKIYEEKRTARREITYDDLLLDLRRALQENDGLVQALRAEYHAALVDEFQDTDPVQYEIFRMIFLEGKKPIFLVGDPKQAIYGFRNGDIFTYYEAKKSIGHQDTLDLDINFRSEEPLVQAMNQVFGDVEINGIVTEPRNEQEGHPRTQVLKVGKRLTFRNENIEYPGTLKAHGKKSEESLTVACKTQDTPFKLWYYSDYEGEKIPGLSNPYARRIYADVAAEIVRILNEKPMIGTREVMPSDIAILVCTHKEADMIHRELTRRRVPAVRQSTGNVFNSSEAEDMQLLLAAVAEPTDITATRSALATDFFGLTYDDLLALMEEKPVRHVQTSGRPPSLALPQASEEGRTEEEEESLGGIHTMEDFVDLFQEANSRWRRGSFIQAFNYLSRRVGLRATLVALENGERRLTNVLQLAELIHQATVRARLTILGAQNWLAKQRESSTREEEDAQEIRLESDADAVRIMTLFKSKGLQFPIVFVPTLWRRNPKLDKSLIEYHEPSGSVASSVSPDGTGTSQAFHHVVDLFPDSDANRKTMDEKLEEDVRLFYVAATRAINRVYVVWGKLYNDEGALAHVLDEGALQAAKTAMEMANKETVRAVGNVEIALKTQENDVDRTPYLVDRAGHLKKTFCTAAEYWGLTVKVDKEHGHASFSSHFSRRSAAEEMPEDYDFDAEDVPFEEQEEQAKSAPGHVSIFNFPAGKRTGKCWHSIFEELDYTSFAPSAPQPALDQARATINDCLDRYRLAKGRTEEEAQQKREVVFEMVKHTLTACLDSNASLYLKDVPRTDRLAEMEFNFSLNDKPGLNTSTIAEVLEKHWHGDETKALFLREIKNRSKNIPRGFMTGSMDLVFRHRGRYYILDWKSNRRGGKSEDFNHEGMRQEMVDHGYFFQYLLYTVAVHHYLKGFMEGYDYEIHFGGVFYIFLRGVDGLGPGRGVFFDKPSLALINELSEKLMK